MPQDYIPRRQYHPQGSDPFSRTGDNRTYYVHETDSGGETHIYGPMSPDGARNFADNIRRTRNSKVKVSNRR